MQEDINGLPIGRLIEFRCNGMPTTTLAVVTSPDESGKQNAITHDGSYNRQFYPADLFPRKAKKGIGFYESGNTMRLTPPNIELIRTRRLCYGNLYYIGLTDSYGKPFALRQPGEAFLLLPRFAVTVTDEPQYKEFYRTTNAYWAHLYEQLSKNYSPQ